MLATWTATYTPDSEFSGTDEIKFTVSNDYGDSEDDNWSIFKGNWKRKGFYVNTGGFSGGCENPQSGDINCDLIVNVIDVISMMNYILGISSDYDEYQLWAADLTGDAVIDVVDIIAIVNLILDS